MSTGNWFDERAEDLRQGLDELAAGDEIEQTNQLLAILVDELTDEDAEEYWSDGFEPTAPGEPDDGQSTATYSSEEGITAQTDSTGEVIFGLTAETVVIRNIDDELEVAFKDPTQHDDAVITVKPKDSPFVISGVNGIHASKLWYKSTAGRNHEFDVLALKKA